jgi:hypothetical protein
MRSVLRFVFFVLTIATISLAQTNSIPGNPVVVNGGDVGVGTSTPGNMLDGNGNAIPTPLLVDILPGSKVGGLVAGGSRVLDATPSERQGFFLRRNDTWNAYNDGLWTGGNSSGPEYWENVILGAQGGGAHLIFMTGGVQAERMRIDTVGNVGIGTSSPAAKLDVAGNIKVSGSGAGIVFPDGTIQTTAQVQGPAGPQGPIGPQGIPGPAVHTSAVCTPSNNFANVAQCSTVCGSSRIIGQTYSSGAGCSITSDTGGCSVPNNLAGSCCACAPN